MILVETRASADKNLTIQLNNDMNDELIVMGTLCTKYISLY